MICFDIETGPLPLDQIREVLPPFDPSSVKHPGEFNPLDVKLGNLKDEQKIADKIDAAREAHEKAVASHSKDVLKAESDHWQAIQERGALKAVTGQVVAIGYQGSAAKIHAAVDGVTEVDLLRGFWRIYRDARKASKSMVGFDIKFFDVPFLAQRSWMLGLEVPKTITTATGYLDSTFIDLNDRWKVGVRGFGEKGYGTLDAICKACGLPSKPNDCTGAEFAAKLWSDDVAEREAAIEYLKNDLVMTASLADRLGVS